MERLLEILSEIKEDVDFSTCTTLIDDGILDSFDILQIISALRNTTFRSPHPKSCRRTSTVPRPFTRWSSACRKIDVRDARNARNIR